MAVSGGGQSKPSEPWSSWAPTDGGTQGAREIADHVAPLYRLSPVDQLAVVTVVNLESTAQATAAAQAAANGTTSSSSGLQVAVRTNPSSSAVSLLGGNTMAYNLCGIGGKNCAIGVSAPSANRLLLLRREALELALYTFKYVSGVDNVVAILPPGHTQQTSTLSKKLPTSDSQSNKPVDIAVLFVKPELQPLLDHHTQRNPSGGVPADRVADGQGSRSGARRSDHRPRFVLRAASAGPGRQQPDRPGSASAPVEPIRLAGHFLPASALLVARAARDR